MSLHPTLKWAQRKDKIFITIGLRDIVDEKVSLKNNSFTFECSSSGKKYECNVQFYEEIDQQKSQWNKTGFQIVFVIAKKDTNKAYWSRLTKQNKKSQYIQCDWDKWIDQDEQQQEGNKGLGDFDYGNMNNFNDSDDEQEFDNKKQQKMDLEDLEGQQNIDPKEQIKPQNNSQKNPELVQ